MPPDVASWDVQKLPCKSRKLLAPFDRLPQCISCVGRVTGSCRFADFRRIGDFESPDSAQLSFHSADAPDPIFADIWNRKPDLSDRQLIAVAVAGVLLPLLRRELSHAADSRAVFRKREMDVRTTCDVCSTSLFVESWFCKRCGIELCGNCWSDLACEDAELRIPSAQCIPCTSAGPHPLIPLSRFDRAELQEAISAMEMALISPSNPIRPIVTTPCPVASVLREGHFTSADFLQDWALGIPVVVSDVDKRLQGRWHPDDFAREYGAQKVSPIDCVSGKVVKPAWTVHDFFAYLKDPGKSKRVMKLKDWPPSKNFHDAFKDLYRGFLRSIPAPCQDTARVDGALNLAAYYPKNGIAPDLGPKMYIATGPKGHRDRYGTTKLHLDVTDAINLLTWCADPTRPAAIWHIFPAHTAGELRKYLREIDPDAQSCDPIHSQGVYVTDDMLNELALREVHPWTISQRHGDAVFIPAGCPHQVRNLQSAIKVACDFVSTQNLGRTLGLLQEQRAHRIHGNGPEDVLQVHMILWYAWLSVTKTGCDSVVHTDQDGEYQGDKGARTREDGQADDSGELGADYVDMLVESTAAVPGEPSAGSDHALIATGSPDAPRKKKIRPKYSKSALAAVAQKPDMIYRCPHPGSARMFNRGGLLDHLIRKHPDIYDGQDQRRLRKNKLSYEQFWMEISRLYKIRPQDGAFPC